MAHRAQITDLCKLADVSAWLLLTPGDDDDRDDLLQRMITAASEGIKEFLSSPVFSATYTKRYQGTGSDRQPLKPKPVTAVSSLTIAGVSIPASITDTANGYFFDDDTLYLRGFVFSTFPRLAVNVTFTAGYATVPTDIEDACIRWIGLRYREQERIGHISKSLAGETVSFTQKDMPDDIKRILSAKSDYRMVA